MKKGNTIKYIIYLIAILITPFVVNAASVNVSTGSLNLTTGNTGSFTISCTDCEGSVTVTSNNAGVAYVVSVGGSGWIDSAGITVQIKANAAGTAVITVKTASVSDTEYNMMDVTKTVTVNVTAPQQQPQTPPGGGGYTPPAPPTPSGSSNRNISSIAGCTKSGNTFTCPETADASISFNIALEDNTASVTSGRTCNLNYGANTCRITVRAQNGQTTAYSVNVKRTDTRNNDATLASLSVDGQTIDFDPSKTSYDLLVNNTIESIIVNATPTDSNATVIGTGEHFLSIGDNVIEIVVTAENEEQNKYVIVVVRSEKANIPSSSLSLLRYNTNNNDESESKDLNVSTGKRIFHIGVDSSVTKLELDYNTSSKTSNFNVQGADNLKEGLNKITIEVTDEGCDKQTYTIYVYRQPIGSKQVDSLKELEEITSDIIYNSNKEEESILPSEVIKLIKDSNNKLIYNITNNDGGVFYSFIIDKNSDINDTISLEFIKTGNNPLSYSSNIPKGIEINAYIEEKYENGTKLKLYTFDQKNNKYILISDDVKVEDGYIKFVSDGSSNYYLSKDELKIKTTGKEWLIRILCIIIGAAIATAINFVVRQVITKKHPELLASKNDEKEKQEVEEQKDEEVKVEEPKAESIKIEREEPKFEIKEEPIEKPIEEPILEPIKPLSIDEIEEEIKPKKELNINNVETSIFPEIDSNDTNFEEPSYEIKPEKEKKSEEPRRNIFGEIIDDTKKSKPTKKVEEEIKPFAEEPVGKFSAHQGIEIEEDNDDIEDISIDDVNLDLDLDLDLDNNINNDIPEEPKKEPKKRKQIFDDDDDDDVVRFPKF